MPAPDTLGAEFTWENCIEAYKPEDSAPEYLVLFGEYLVFVSKNIQTSCWGF